MKTPFVWLGSKRAEKRGVSAKGALLDRAAAAGLPVPAGGILLHEFYQLLLDEGLIHVSGQRVWADNPTEIYEALYTAVRFPRLERAAAVRTAFSYADGDGDAVSVRAPVQRDVDLSQPQALTEALCAVWSAALSPAALLRQDVLIMEMVTAEVAGTAISNKMDAEDQVRLTKEAQQKTIGLPKLQRWWERPCSDCPPFAPRLQQLLRGTRRTLGDDSSWEIEWLDDGQICWLIQIRPFSHHDVAIR